VAQAFHLYCTKIIPKILVIFWCRSILGQLFSWLPSWKPTSESLLEEAEKEVLKGEGVMK